MVHRETSRLAHVLLTDEPGVLVHNPRQKLVRILILYALLPLICSVAGGFIAYQFANAAMEHRVDALEGDLAQRRAARAAEDRQRDAKLDQNRRDLCVVLDRLTPRDRPVEDLRHKYGCTGASVTAPPAPSPSPNRTTPAGRAAEPTRDVPAGSGAAPSRQPRPAPAPGPPGATGPSGPPGPSAPASPPPPPGDDNLLCLPLLGCLL